MRWSRGGAELVADAAADRKRTVRRTHMFGPRKGPPKPVPPKRRGAPARKPKPTREEEEALKQQKYLDELGALKLLTRPRRLPVVSSMHSIFDLFLGRGALRRRRRVRGDREARRGGSRGDRSATWPPRVQWTRRTGLFARRGVFHARPTPPPMRRAGLKFSRKPNDDPSRHRRAECFSAPSPALALNPKP